MTRDLGLVRGIAIGVRKETSKLRGHIEPFSLVSISFVKGKDYWRLTSAEFIKNISPTSVIARPLSLVEKLVQGEAPNPELFDTLEKAVLLQEPDDEMFEIRLVSQILFHLGYLKEVDLTLDKKQLVKVINDGLHASQLT